MSNQITVKLSVSKTHCTGIVFLVFFNLLCRSGTCLVSLFSFSLSPSPSLCGLMPSVICCGSCSAATELKFIQFRIHSECIQLDKRVPNWGRRKYQKEGSSKGNRRKRVKGKLWGQLCSCVRHSVRVCVRTCVACLSTWGSELIFLLY